jgi:hypothetical protein
LDAPTVRRIRPLPSLGLVLTLFLAGLSEVAQAGAAEVGGVAAVPVIEIRPAGADDWDAVASAEQQPGLDATFFLRVTNAGDAGGSFTLEGEHGGADFAIRYLEGGAGDRRITDAVVNGTYTIQVPPGATRVLRLRARVAGSAPIDRNGDWTVEVEAVDDASVTDAATAEVRTVTRAFARAAGVTLRVPAEEASITFHESLFPSAAAMRPLGTLLRNANGSKYSAPPDGPGPGYIVMGSRGRPTPATSGSDDVVDADEPILAPVSGIVIRVTSYLLYCGWEDVRVAIRPDEAPERTVQIFHLRAPRVRRGDHVLVSHTVLGLARLFPFRSQTQDYGLGGRHVHLEVERDGSTPLPGCAPEPIR